MNLDFSRFTPGCKKNCAPARPVEELTYCRRVGRWTEQTTRAGRGRGRALNCDCCRNGSVDRHEVPFSVLLSAMWWRGTLTCRHSHTHTHTISCGGLVFVPRGQIGGRRQRTLSHTHTDERPVYTGLAPPAVHITFSSVDISVSPFLSSFLFAQYLKKNVLIIKFIITITGSHYIVDALWWFSPTVKPHQCFCTFCISHTVK